MIAIIILRAFLVLDPTNLQELIARGCFCCCTDFFRSIAEYKKQCAAFWNKTFKIVMSLFTWLTLGSHLYENI